MTHQVRTYPPRVMETCVMETFRKNPGHSDFCHEVAHWKLFGVMGTFAILAGICLLLVGFAVILVQNAEYPTK